MNIPALIAKLRDNGNFGMVALVGVQSNQYPRSLDIARPFRAAGIPVGIGGFHVSGCLSMLDGHAVGLDECRELGISIFAGEAEGRLDKVLHDAAYGKLAAALRFPEGPSRHQRHAARSCRSNMSKARSARRPASMPAAVAPFNARSARSSTCRAASHGIARPTTSSASCA